MVLDAFANASNIPFKQERLAFKSEIKFKGRNLILIKPTTYMNLSGKAINYWLQEEKIAIENLLIITDDLALPFGALRLKEKGGDGGHNGLKSIIESLSSESYARLRIGIGNTFSKGKQVNYVLGEWTEQELKTVPLIINQAVEVIKSFVSIGVNLTMTNFNNKIIEI